MNRIKPLDLDPIPVVFFVFLSAVVFGAAVILWPHALDPVIPTFFTGNPLLPEIIVGYFTLALGVLGNMFLEFRKSKLLLLCLGTSIGVFLFLAAMFVLAPVANTGITYVVLAVASIWAFINQTRIHRTFDAPQKRNNI